jgi:hypothetical protein
MAYWAALLISIICWLFWGIAASSGLKEEDAVASLGLSIGCFIAFGLIQAMLRRSIASNRAQLILYNARQTDFPVFKPNDSLLVEDQLRALGIGIESDHDFSKVEAIPAEVTRLYEILDE